MARWWTGIAALVALPAMAAAEQGTFDAPTVEDAIACKLDVPGYNGFAMWLAGPDDGAARLRWKKVEGKNPFLQEYRLPAPITVFDRQTDRIALTGSSVLAMLKGVAPEALAREQGIEDTLPAAPKFLGERVIAESSEEDAELGMRFSSRISLNVSSVDTHPGVALIGCAYTIDMTELDAGTGK